jgi:hypothetical protein
MVAVVNAPGYSGRKGTGLFVAVLTPLIGPLQLNGTMALPGTGDRKNTLMFWPGS